MQHQKFDHQREKENQAVNVCINKSGAYLAVKIPRENATVLCRDTHSKYFTVREEEVRNEKCHSAHAIYGLLYIMLRVFNRNAIRRFLTFSY